MWTYAFLCFTASQSDLCSFVDFSELKKSQRSRREDDAQHRIKRAQELGTLGCHNRSVWIAGLSLDE